MRAPRGKGCSLSFPGTSGEESDVSSGKARPLSKPWVALLGGQVLSLLFPPLGPWGHTRHTQGRRKPCLLSVSIVGRIWVCMAPSY